MHGAETKSKEADMEKGEMSRFVLTQTEVSLRVYCFALSGFTIGKWSLANPSL